MRLGFVGTGAITSAIVTGLNAAGIDGDTILVSPRNAETAAALAAKFPNVTVAASNQAVLDGSNVVIIAVRPRRQQCGDDRGPAAGLYGGPIRP